MHNYTINIVGRRHIPKSSSNFPSRKITPELLRGSPILTISTKYGIIEKSEYFYKILNYILLKEGERMLIPKIVETKFVDKADSAINSDVLRGIFYHTLVSRPALGYNYESRMPYFQNQRLTAWGVRIEDKHDKGEKTPHYVLEVGIEGYKNLQHAAFSVTYCDYRSVLKGRSKKIAKNDILLNPGEYIIHIWLPRDYDEDSFMGFARVVSSVYYDAMIKALPNYEILVDNDHLVRTA